MIRSLEKDVRGTIYAANFGKMGVGTAKMPWSFADEYYKKAIPFLRKIGVRHLETFATTEADNPHSEKGRMVGAYIWCKYGYKNTNIDATHADYLKYLRDIRKFSLEDFEIDDIKNKTRMLDLVKHTMFILKSISNTIIINLWCPHGYEILSTSVSWC